MEKNNQFVEACRFIETNLKDKVMDRVFNSIGSNVFFQFGKELEVSFNKGRKSIAKEWSIWISRACWRITQNQKYIVGSFDDSELIQTHIEKLLGKRFLSFRFFSQFMDVEFTFEDGYQIKTFFNCSAEDQWIIFFPNYPNCLPDQKTIGINCSNQEEIQSVMSLSQCFDIEEYYEKLYEIDRELIVHSITYKNDKEYDAGRLPTLHFNDGSFIRMLGCTCRLEKNFEYVCGYWDDDEDAFKKNLEALMGLKLNRIEVTPFMMDARLLFENEYTLKTFTCSAASVQWEFGNREDLIFSARPPSGLSKITRFPT